MIQNRYPFIYLRSIQGNLPSTTRQSRFSRGSVKKSKIFLPPTKSDDRGILLVQVKGFLKNISVDRKKREKNMSKAMIQSHYLTILDRTCKSSPNFHSKTTGERIWI